MNQTAAAEGRESRSMISRLFFRLLPIQVMIIAMGSINSIVDGVIAARFIGQNAMAVVGLYYTVLRVVEAIGNLLVGGTVVLCGRYLGSGKMDKARGVCSLSLTLAVLSGAVLTAVSLSMPERMAVLLGANEQLKADLTAYILGYAAGLIPQMAGQQLAVVLQLECQDKRGHAGVAVMMALNVILDLLFIVVWRMGLLGLALATSIANWGYFLVVAGYYLSDKAQIRPGFRTAAWKEMGPVLKNGFPNALLVVCMVPRSLLLNRLLLTYAGEDGVSALSAYNMIGGLLLALCLGSGAVVRMLSSVFLGEDNRESLLTLIRLAMTRMMACIVCFAAAVIALSPAIAGIFFPDAGSAVFGMTRELMMIYCAAMPLVLTCIICSSYAQSAGFRGYSNLASMTDGFFSVAIPAVLLAPVLGSTGVWLSFPLGLVITLAVTLIYLLVKNRHWPHGADEWLLLKPDFGSGERLVVHIRSTEEVVQTSGQVETFCLAHGVQPRISSFAGLCLEELAGNIVEHGFTSDRRRHSVEIRVVIKDSDVVLRVKDDCKPFNPKEQVELTASEDPVSNIGIRLVYGLADEVEYQNLLGLNVLTVRLKTFGASEQI